MEKFLKNGEIVPAQFSDFSPELRELVGELVLNGKTDLLRCLAILLVKNGKAENETKAYQIIDSLVIQIAGKISRSNVVVNCTDLVGRFRIQLAQIIKKLKIAIGEETTTGNFPSLLLGSLSHETVLSFLKGCLPDKVENKNPPQPDFKQTHLFKKSPDETSIILPISNALTGPVTNHGAVEYAIINKIKICWSEIAILRNLKDPEELLGKSESGVEELEKLLGKIFGSRLNALKNICDRYPNGNYFYLMILMTWASAVIFYFEKSKNCALFSEISSLSSRFGSVGGRIDGVEVISIDGRPLNVNQCQTVRQLSSVWNLNQNCSVGYLVRELQKIFKNIELKIWELKFAIGDSVGSFNIIQPGQVAEAGFLPHQNQVKRYLALANWDAGALIKDEGREGLKHGYLKEAELIYFFPFDLPLIHKFKLTEPELKRAFFDQIAAHWLTAERRAETRAVITGLTKTVLEYASGGKTTALPNSAPNVQTEMFSPTPNGVKSLKESIQGLRTFADSQTKIIELVGHDAKTGEPKYAMHYDRLLLAIENGSVRIGRFNPETGGFIACLDDKHNEKTPSMSVSLERGTFHCFGCEIDGKILRHSVPRNLQIKIDATRAIFAKRKIKLAGEVLLSERHFEVMALAQKILGEEFLKDTRGQKYLESRGLRNHALAQELKVGFGNNKLIEGLMSQSVSFEELIYFGFLGFSTKIKSSFPLCQFLLKQSLSLEEIKRPVSTQETGLPYSVLDRRVTAPLSLPDGRVTSLYGRAIWTSDRIMAHRKLKTNHPGFTHGAYNMEVLNSDYPILIVVEGLTDLLSLYLMGAKEVMALVGVKNSFIVQSIAQSKKKVIFIGFDNDPSKIIDGEEKRQTGQRFTQKLFEELRQLGFQNELRNLMAEFLKLHPECLACKDFNEIFQKHGALSLAPIIQP